MEKETNILQAETKSSSMEKTNNKKNGTEKEVKIEFIYFYYYFYYNNIIYNV